MSEFSRRPAQAERRAALRVSGSFWRRTGALNRACCLEEKCVSIALSGCEGGVACIVGKEVSADARGKVDG